MKFDKDTLLLYAVTDSKWATNIPLINQVEEALKGGVTCVQLREKDLGYAEFLEKAIAFNKLCTSYNIPLIINDNVEVAIESKAHGIHVGQMDMETENVRKKIGKDMILGVSVKTVEQAKLAERNGANYLGVGAVFSTTTKLDATIVDHDTLKEICNSVNIPVVAIGGIYKHNILELKGTKVDGVALVSAIFAKDSIEKECMELKKLSKEMTKGD
ncbi:MAG: thiamine phosphate synthase [Lachnospirales bacterium]